ncbi:MAG: hypothetical protein WBB34_15140 [Xanthobacteraceae bacterium]
MVEIFLGFLAFAFGLAVMSATGIIVVYKLWDEPPQQIQKLAELFMVILDTSAKVILGPSELWKRVNVSIVGRTLPPTGPFVSNEMTDQIEGSRTMAKLLAAPETLHK